MLADQLDYIVGVDPHRDSHALAVVQVVSGTVVFETTIDANSDGYAHALQLVDEHAPGRRAFAIEGTGSFGAGLTRFLTGRRERVLEVTRLRRERRSSGKTDALDAVRRGPQRPPLALRSIARRVLQLTVEERELAREIETLTRRLHRSCSTSPVSVHTPPHSSCSPGHTEGGSAPKPPSPGSPAPHRSRPHPANDPLPARP